MSVYESVHESVDEFHECTCQRQRDWQAVDSILTRMPRVSQRDLPPTYMMKRRRGSGRMSRQRKVEEQYKKHVGVIENYIYIKCHGAGRGHLGYIGFNIVKSQEMGTNRVELLSGDTE